MKDKPVVHTLDTAAEFAKVEPKVILRWIREGLRATPVGTVGRRGKRDYRIFEAWLVEFMERRSEVAAPGVDEDSGEKPKIVKYPVRPKVDPMNLTIERRR